GAGSLSRIPAPPASQARGALFYPKPEAAEANPESGQSLPRRIYPAGPSRDRQGPLADPQGNRRHHHHGDDHDDHPRLLLLRHRRALLEHRQISAELPRLTRRHTRKQCPVGTSSTLIPASRTRSATRSTRKRPAWASNASSSKSKYRPRR